MFAALVSSIAQLNAWIARSIEDVTPLFKLLKEIGVFALLGLLVGAFVTYRFANKAQKSKERDQQFADGVKAQFALVSQLTRARHLRKEYLEAALKDLPPEAVRSYDLGLNYQAVDFASLHFMLDNVASANILTGILHAESLFRDVISLVSRRNQLHEEFRRNLAEQRNASNPTIDDLLRVSLAVITNDLYAHAGLTLDALYEQYLAIDNELRRRFPNHADPAITLDKDW